jgi:hypothetical protein
MREQMPIAGNFWVRKLKNGLTVGKKCKGCIKKDQIIVRSKIRYKRHTCYAHNSSLVVVVLWGENLTEPYVDV